mmetsp:Transcript_1978/g.1436  ORF Transcript_1978/g.1436 Transcript_1978/m.1436 type:complete len:96 (+) Transcript_1978:567-854(+)
MIPKKATFNGSFIAANQGDRADDVISGNNKEIIAQLRKDIQDMKAKVDKVIILWTANTERYLLPEISDINRLKDMIERNIELPSSVLYCIAAIEE